VLSILSTPALIRLSSRVGELLARAGGDGLAGDREPEPPFEEGHVIIAGFGVNGQNLVRVLKTVGVPFVVVELNGVTVQRLAAQGEPIRYGDVTSPGTLAHLGVGRARELVLAISDPAATRSAVKLARDMAPGLKIVVRTRYVNEIEKLYELGADMVVTDEMEASLRLVSVVLADCNVAAGVRLRLVDEILKDHYGGLAPSADGDPARLPPFPTAGVESRTVELSSSAFAVGRSLASLHLRGRSGATCLSVQRGIHVHANPDSGFELAAGDRAVLFGEGRAVARAERLLTVGEASLPGGVEVPRRRATDRVDE